MNATRKNRRGFTLVELLAVIAIIAVLLTMLMPVISEAKEQAKVSVCSTNLRGLGSMAHMHASDNKSWFPQTFRNNGENHGPYIFLEYWRTEDTDLEDDRWYGNRSYNQWHRGNNPGCDELSTAWKHYGTLVSTWESYGMQIENLACPGDERSDLLEEKEARNSNAIVSSYQWISGAYHSYDYHSRHVRNAGLRLPALTSEADNPGQRVLAADMVYTWSYSNGGGTVYINHAAGEDLKASAQNVLFADGHVATERSFYTKPLNQISLQAARYSWGYSKNTLLGLYYWGTGK